MPRDSRFSIPSVDAAIGGVFVDFEANIGKAPSLLGVLKCQGEGHAIFEQHIIEGALAPAVVSWPLTGRGHCVVSTSSSAVERVLDLIDGNADVFAYAARHERALLSQIPGGDHLADRLVDVLPLARRWRRTMHSGARFDATGNSLRNMASLIGCSYPKHLGERQVGPGLTRVRAQLASKEGNWRRVSKGAKSQWAKLLQKNQLDCTFTRDLTIQICRDLS
jgi:hypothetical protein